MRRALIVILAIAAVAVGGAFIAQTAYQAGIAANVTVVAPATTGTTSGDGTVVAPVVVPAYGWGWGHGFGWGPGFSIFGFLVTLFVILLFIGLIRALTFRGGPGRWGPGGPGRWGGPDHDHGSSPWEARAREHFDAWHRTAHDQPTPPSTPTTPTSPAT